MSRLLLLIPDLNTSVQSTMRLPRGVVLEAMPECASIWERGQNENELCTLCNCSLLHVSELLSLKLRIK